MKISFALVLLLTCFSSRAGNPIDTAMAVDIGGIKQWITMKSTSDTNPVLLFLHGGPGNSVMSYADKFTGELQKKFVVVHWDQRESGNTATLNKSTQPLTVALMENDAIEVIHFLQDRFLQEKIYLMGHSWGGFLGLMIASHHPELLKGYIAICPMIHQRESEKISLQWMKDRAKSEKNNQALNELSMVRIPFENGEQLYYHRSWLIRFMGGKPASKDVVVSWSQKWLALFNEASEINFMALAPVLNCPVYFFEGDKDHQTYYKLTVDYYNMVSADKKKLFIFNNTAHNLPTKEPIKLQKTIIQEVE